MERRTREETGDVAFKSKRRPPEPRVRFARGVPTDRAALKQHSQRAFQERSRTNERRSYEPIDPCRDAVVAGERSR